MRPKKKELVPYKENVEKITKDFSVSHRTVIRWLKYYNMYYPRSNYGANKLSMDTARDIRNKYYDGMVMKDLAEEYKVTFSTISRVIHNITYKQVIGTAEISVIYNI